MISYDLRMPGQDYARLEKEILSLGEAIKPLYSLWFVKTSYTPEQIKNKLIALDSTDRMIVIAVTSPGASYGIDNNSITWINNRL